MIMELSGLTQPHYNEILAHLKGKRIIEYDLFSANNLGSTAYKMIPESENVLIFAALHIITEENGKYKGFISSGIRTSKPLTVIRERSKNFSNENAKSIAAFIVETMHETLGVR